MKIGDLVLLRNDDDHKYTFSFGVVCEVIGDNCLVFFGDEKKWCAIKTLEVINENR